jgi:predicted TIM-barrel fold metal-dependent hydrolase
MGFKPLGNAGDGDLAYPQHALRGLSAGQLALRLDQRLVELYKWCAEKGVPILSHAANSNGSGPCYAERADTANWLAVVAHPVAKEIRLCLAHIGSFDAARDRNKKINVNALQQSWEWHFGKLIQLPNAKNVYADLSYFSELLKSPRDEDFNALKQAFATLIRKFPNVTDRLIYGSDWIMLDRELKKEEHLKAVYWFLHDVFRLAQVPDPRGALIKVFSTNALKFLGLGKNERGKNDQTRERLLAFYRKYNLRDADRLLDEFVI